MEQIKGTLIDKIQRTSNVWSLRFKPEKKIDFIPGQFMEVIFDANNKDLRHYLSFSSSPTKDYFEFTKKVSESPFSKRMLELKIGDTVDFKMPLGKCVFKEEYTKIGFIIGGIGITPVISILEYIEDKKLATDSFLIYSNWTEDDIAFFEELNSWEKEINLETIHVLNKCNPDKPCPPNYICDTFIDKNVLEKFKDKLAGRKIFVLGPPKMVNAIEKTCLEIGIEKENLLIERFMGY